MGEKLKIEIAKHEHENYYVIVVNDDNILGRENQEVLKFATKDEASAFVEWIITELAKGGQT